MTNEGAPQSSKPVEPRSEVTRTVVWAALPDSYSEFGIPHATIDAIAGVVEDNEPITPEIAAALSTMGPTEKYWLGLQAKYEKELARWQSKT